jgi:hypothetical protein
MPGTPETADLSNIPLPTQEQIEQQRKLIAERLRQYGYAPRQLSDQEVLSTMAPMRQGPVQWPEWVTEYLRRNPQENVTARAGRPGVDTPYNQTYEEWNLRNKALNPSTPTSVGVNYAVPRNALAERYGDAAYTAARQADPFWGFNLRDTPLLARIRSGEALPEEVKAANLQPGNWNDLHQERARQFYQLYDQMSRRQ